MLALQEWRHWLEGVAEPFIVWTDNNNLALVSMIYEWKEILVFDDYVIKLTKVYAWM